MKILHVLDHSIPLHSGYTFRTLAILRQQRAMGWQTAHLTGGKQENCEVPEEIVDGYHFYRTPAAIKPLRKAFERLPVLNQVAIIQQLEDRLEEVVGIEQPDIIHAHSPALDGLAAIRVGKRHKLPVVYEMRASWEDAAVDHGSTTEGSLRYRLSRALETRVLKRSDAIVTISAGLCDDIASRGIDKDRITLVPNAVDLSRFSRIARDTSKLRQDLGLGPHAPVLGFIGSFYGYEGLHLIIEALPEIRKQLPELRLILVGGGFQEQQLRQQVEQAGLHAAVIFTGRVPHEQVHDYYSLMDCLIYPRLPIRLTEIVTPLKPLEAMAEGKLVLASNVGGHRELIRDGENGRLFEAGNSNALAEQVLKLFADREHWPALHEAGRRFVEEERNWPAVVARYAGVYERVLAG